MSFDLYFVGIPSLKYGVDKFLYSQYYDRAKIQKFKTYLSKPTSKLFLDSGAFTAFTRGVQLDIDEYLRYINHNDMITVAAALDVLPSSTLGADEAAFKSWENFLYMRKRIHAVNKLIPVYHQGEHIENLYRILEYEDEFGKVEYMGLGAIANIVDINSRERFISECFRHIVKLRPDIKVHGFGMTDLKLLEMFPFYSADSTTWCMAAGMGEILAKNGRLTVSAQRKHDLKYSLRTVQMRDAVDEYVSGFGFDLSDLETSREMRCRFNVAYLLDWEKTRVCRYEKTSVRKLF